LISFQLGINLRRDRNNFSLVQARLIGVAYWEKPVGDELHLVGHGQVSIYKTLFNEIRQKWPAA